MKKLAYTLMTAIALLSWSCEKVDDYKPANGNTTEERKPDITPYLGSYLMSRTSDLTISIMDMTSFPINYDWDMEIVTIAADPDVQYGVIMTSTDGMYIKGTVDTLGLHLQADTIDLEIDTMGVNATVLVTMTHPIISAPEDGAMSWTSVAEGSGTVTVPIIGELTATITGNMKYRTINTATN